MTNALASPRPSSDACYNIAAVERDTGLSKDTLRVWERRYGFPKPLRDQHDERLYSLPELEKLRLLRLLIDYGHRPGKIINRSTSELSQLISSRTPKQTPPPEIDAILDLLLRHDVDGFRNAAPVGNARLPSANIFTCLARGGSRVCRYSSPVLVISPGMVREGVTSSGRMPYFKMNSASSRRRVAAEDVALSPEERRPAMSLRSLIVVFGALGNAFHQS